MSRRLLNRGFPHSLKKVYFAPLAESALQNLPVISLGLAEPVQRIGISPMSTLRILSCSLLTLSLIGGSVSAQSRDRDSGGLEFSPLIIGNSPREEVAKAEITAELRKIDDQSVELLVTATVPEGYYIYSMDKSFGAATNIKLTELGSLTDSGEEWKADHEPKAVMDDDFGRIVEKFFGTVTWSKVLHGVPAEDIKVVGKLSGQYCGSGENGIAGECRPIRNREFTATLATSKNTAPKATALKTDEAGADQASGDEAEAAVPEADKNPVSLSPKIGFGRAARAGLIELEIGLTPEHAAVGQEVTLSIKATVKEPWHTFALDQDPEMAGEPTTIEIASLTGLEPVGEKFQPSSEPDIQTILEYVQRVHHGEIVWSRKYIVAAPKVALTGSILFQMCNNGSCLPPTTAEFDLTLTAAKSTGVPAAVGSTPNAGTGKTANGKKRGIAKDGLLAFLLTAIGAGFVALLTPCVFPMIPVTVAFFLKQEEKKAGSSLGLAIVYCLSIIGAFTILGLVCAAAFGEGALQAFANNRWLNLGFAALFVFFGLMLLGVMDIQLPHWMLTWTSKRESTGGIVGVVFMAITFTLVSFTCTFAFVGSLLVVAARGDYLWPVIGMLGFSTAFASPFFVLALFPKMLKKLPRSGGWMNDVKVVIGLVELAAVVKFLSVADIGFADRRMPVFLTYNVFLWTWIILAAIAGLYLLGVARKPRPKFSFIRYGSAALFLAFAGRLMAGLYGVPLPADPVWNLVAAFSPPNVQATPIRETDDLGYVIAHHDQDFMLEFERAVELASKDQQALFLDFTGVNCVNCRQMERTVMVEKSVVAAMEKMVRAQLYTDEVPGIEDEELREKLLLLNQELQSELTGDVALPSYAVVSPDGKTVLSYYSGVDSSGGKDFLEFLNDGLGRWETLKAKPAESADVNNASVPVQTVGFQK